MPKLFRTFAFAVTLTCFVSSSKAQDIKKAWHEVLSSCSHSDVFGNNVVFFGPSNTIGLGSVWRKSGSTYNPRFQLSDLIPDDAIRGKVIQLGVPLTQCTGNHTAGWSASLGLPMVPLFAAATGVDIQLDQARQITVGVDKLSLDVLMEVPFDAAVSTRKQQAGLTDPYLRDLFARDRLIMNKAYRITGMTVTADYSPDQLKDLKTKYPEGATVKLGGDKGATASFGYKGTSTLTLKLSTDVYIAGELAKLAGGSTALTGNVIAPVKASFEPVALSPAATVGKVDPVTH